MLNALAMIIADEFLDLAMFVLTFVKGDADLVVRGCHGAAEKTGRLSFYVEITNLAEIEDLLIIRSEEHTSELQSLMRISYAVLCLKKKISKIITEKFYT